MRQTEAKERNTIGTEDDLNQSASFPDVLLYRGRAADGEECLATFDRHTIVLSRPVAGLPCRIRLSVKQYQAVAVILADEGCVVRLLHGEDGLSIDLALLDDLQQAETYCQRLAGFLQLPSVTMGAGRAGKGAPGAGRPSRRPQLTKGRRPRFLTGRRAGEVVQIRKLEKRELIARH